MNIKKRESGFYTAYHVPSKKKFYIQSPERTEAGFWIITDVSEGFGCEIELPVYTKTLREAKAHLNSKTAEYNSLY